MEHFRKATTADIPFLIEGIIASEKSGTYILSYARIFSISEAEVVALITQIMEEEIENQEWNPGSFVIAEMEGKPVACLSAWIEGQGGTGSGILKAQAMSYFLGNVWAQSIEKLKLVASVQIPRLTDCLQLENIYTAPEYRGKGIAGRLIEFAIENAKVAAPDLQQAEIQLMANNTAAVVSYTKCGFLQRAASVATDPAVLTLLPGDSKISLSKNV